MDPLIAHGGVCAPVDPLYDIIPTFKANRGPVKFEPVKTLNKDQRFLDMACGVALESKCRMKHGAIVVRHSKILGSSPNVERNNPKIVGWANASVHAEIRAMKRAGWPTKATIYVARVNNHGERRLSKPCPNCQEVLDQFKIKVVYTV